MEAFAVVAVLWFYVTTPFLVAVVASEKGRSGVRWFIASLFVTPWACLIALAAIPDTTNQPRKTLDELRAAREAAELRGMLP